MFTDKRSKKIILLAHCLLNQNAKSDGTAMYGGVFTELIDIIKGSDIGILQLVCPELQCLGLDRGDNKGSERPVIEENSRIRKALESDHSNEKLESLINSTILQVEEYYKHGFEIIGLIGINRSPSCGVETTSIDNQEVLGQGVFIEKLQSELSKNDHYIPMIGIKLFETEDALEKIKTLLKKL